MYMDSHFENQVAQAKKALSIHKQSLDAANDEKSALLFDVNPQSLVMRANNDEHSRKLFVDAQKRLDEKIARIKSTIAQCEQHLNEIQSSSTNFAQVQEQIPNSTVMRAARNSINKSDSVSSPSPLRKNNHETNHVSEDSKKQVNFVRPRIASMNSPQLPRIKSNEQSPTLQRLQTAIKVESNDNLHSRMSPQISSPTQRRLSSNLQSHDSNNYLVLAEGNQIPLWKMDIKPQSFENVHSRIMTPNIIDEPPKILPIFGSTKINKAYYEEPVAFIKQFEAVMHASKTKEDLWATTLVSCIVSEEVANLVAKWIHHGVSWSVIKDRFIVHSHDNHNNDTFNYVQSKISSTVELDQLPIPSRLPIFGLKSLNKSYYEETVPFLKQFEAIMKSSKYPEEKWVFCLSYCMSTPELNELITSYVNEGITWDELKNRFVSHNHSAGQKCMSGDCVLRKNETVVGGYHIHELPVIENKIATEVKINDTHFSIK